MLTAELAKRAERVVSVELDKRLLPVLEETLGEFPHVKIIQGDILKLDLHRVFTRDQLLDEVWGFDYYGDSRTVDVHVKRLREKLEGVSDKWSLKTVWGVGYKFEVKE